MRLRPQIDTTNILIARSLTISKIGTRGVRWFMDGVSEEGAGISPGSLVGFAYTAER
jgi:hypothetical protein